MPRHVFGSCLGNHRLRHQAHAYRELRDIQLTGLLDLKNAQSYDLIVMAKDLTRQKQYEIIVTETVQENLTVTTGDKEEVIKLAQSLYRSGQLVLEPGELVKVKFTARAVHREEC